MLDRLPAPYTPETTDLTPAEATERDRTARLLDGQIHDCVRVGRAALWELAKRLYDFSEHGGASALGYRKEADYLADRPELGISPDTYYRMARVWRETAVRRGVPVATLQVLDLSKADIVLPAVKDNRVPIVKALEDARTLTASELRKRYSQPRALETAAEPKPERAVVALQEHEADDAPLVASSPTPQPVEAARLASEPPPDDWGAPTISDPYVEHEDGDEPEPDAGAGDFIEARISRDLVAAARTALDDYTSLADLSEAVGRLLDALEAPVS